MFKVIQINVGRINSAHDLAKLIAKREKCDFLAINEPNSNRLSGRECYVSEDGNAMLIRTCKDCPVEAYRSFGCTVCVETTDLIVYCSYVSPNKCTMTEFGEHLLRIQTDIITFGKGKMVAITGDFNARNPCWGGEITNRRGKEMLEWANSLNLIILNDGKQPTCIRPNGKSYIDLTILNERAYSKRPTWNVLDDASLSDHEYTMCEWNVPKNEKRRYIYGIINPNALCDKFTELTRDKEINTEAYERAMGEAYRQSTPRIRANDDGKLPYWWTLAIQDQIRSTNQKRREFQKCKNNNIKLTLKEAYKESKKTLKKEITASKRRQWSQLCENLNDDIFGNAYQIVRARMHQPCPNTQLSTKKKEEIFKKLFITIPSAPMLKEENQDTSNHQLEVCEEELVKAIKRIKMGKAPGPDNIPPDALKAVAIKNIDYYKNMFSELLRTGKLPETWKCAKLILIEKPKKSVHEETKYRPICLLNSVGKLFETIVNERLMYELESKKALNDSQHGFRRGKSTVGAVDQIVSTATEARMSGKLNALILIDVQNAFNMASWPITIEKLKRKNISSYLVNVIIDYFTARRVQLGKNKCLEIGGGVPQGSVLGPTLWNVMYDDVMSLEVPEGVRLVCYADDLAVSVTARTARELVSITDTSLHAIDLWMKTNKLRIAAHKTVAIILSGGRRANNIQFEIAGEKIRTSNEAKYLGVIMDTKLNFGKHVQYVCEKAQKTARAMHSILPNTKGPSEIKRRILAMTVQSIILYASSVWEKTLSRQTQVQKILGAQRAAALRVCRAYRTASTEAVLVISGLLPLNILVEERARIYTGTEALSNDEKRREREISIVKWQDSWDSSQKGRWTHRLIKELEPWLSRKHGEVTFRMTQCLTGHGVFGRFLKRIDKVPTEECLYCRAAVDDPEHTLFVCNRWAGERATLLGEVGRGSINADTIVELMLQSLKNWKAVESYMETVIRQKEVDENMRQRTIN